LPLPWFRRRKPEGPAPSTAADAAPHTPELTITKAAPAVPEAGSDEADATKKRRRGTRGGRNRKRKTAVDGAARPSGAKSSAAKTTAAKADGAEKKKTAERKTRAQQPRRRQAPKRAPLPKAKRELLISVDAGEKRVAVLEDDKVAEVYLERPERRSIAGAVYLGVVDNVLPGMEAAFIEIGLEKNGFLYVDEIIAPELEGRRGARKIQDLIQRGQTVLVQAVKDPMKTKGARLTTEISLPGRFVVYVPHGEGLGVSRRLEDEERTRLKAILKECAPKKGGVIVRTAAEGASAEDIERDLDFLQRLWKSIEGRAKESSAPALIYQEAELPLRVVRDLFTGDFERLLVDHDRTHRRIVGYLKKTSPHMAERVVRYKEREPLMEAFGVEQEIKSTLNRRVDLPSGGYLVFDYAEAFTVIDVNTGRYVGSRSKSSSARLEDTITKNNLEAVKEVVRQLRLRDIGGIIVIDFIDMANPKNRAAVEEALRTELERDRTKTYVVEISPLGLVEMTRQNVTDGPREVMTKKCPTCGGDGIVVSEQTAAVDVERRLRSLVTPGSRSKAFKVEVSARTAAIVAGPGGSRLREIEETTKRRFFLVGKADEHADHFRVLAQGTLEKVAPESPVQLAQELELSLGEVGLYDAHAGVAKLDGTEVYVADAAKLVGKKVKARITLVTEGMAWAELLSPVEAPREPLTAEAEAEKPTRARRSTRAKTEPTEAAEALEAPEEPAADEAPGDEPAEVAAEAEAGETAAAPKKRTRRGTRGGRNRKKKTAATPTAPVDANGTDPAAPAPPPADEAPPAPEPEAEPSPNGDGGPVIHVPDRTLGDEGEGGAAAPRKRTRRGTRGGRNRKKKNAAASVGTDAPAEATAVEPAPDLERDPEPKPVATNGDRDDDEWGYTPMSEWGLDGE
jgi:ribonuclease G